MSVDVRATVKTKVTQLSNRISSLRRTEVLTSLRLLGTNEYDLLLPETRYLYDMMDYGEVIFGIVYGKYTLHNPVSNGRGLLAVTDKRLLFITKKPLFSERKTLQFETIKAVDTSPVGAGEVITLICGTQTISLTTFDNVGTKQFVAAARDMVAAEKKGWVQHDYSSG